MPHDVQNKIFQPTQQGVFFRMRSIYILALAVGLVYGFVAAKYFSKSHLAAWPIEELVKYLHDKLLHTAIVLMLLILLLVLERMFDRHQRSLAPFFATAKELLDVPTGGFRLALVSALYASAGLLLGDALTNTGLPWPTCIVGVVLAVSFGIILDGVANYILALPF